jgi:hypothetical protein
LGAKGLDPKGEMRSPMDFGGIWRLGKIALHFMGYIMMDSVIAKWVSEDYGTKFPFPC